jgi:predicted deacetylase
MILGKVVDTVEDNTIILSMHDISPVFEDDIVQSYDLLSDLGITSLTLLVTPFYGLKKSNKFTSRDIFSKFISSLDLEISMHGFSHFAKSGSMNEFDKLTRDKATSRLKDGVSILKSGFGKKPVGFVPPTWESAPKIVKAVKQIGLDYCVNGNLIYDHTKNKVVQTADRIVSQGQRSLSIETALFEIELGGALQIGIHPSDYKVNTLFDLLSELKDRLEYRFIGFKDYLSTI